jgi:hypothetical protein
VSTLLRKDDTFVKSFLKTCHNPSIYLLQNLMIARMRRRRKEKEERRGTASTSTITRAGLHQSLTR